MGNLTSDLQIVKPVVGVAPMPGHHLVVFKKVGNGQVFHSVMPPDQKVRFGGILLGSLVAYAVTGAPNLRHRFTIGQLRSRENLGPFSLSITLALAVADPRRLVETLDTDPLRRLEDEAGDIFKVLVSHIAWLEIINDAAGLERRLLQARASTGEVSFNYLRDFAAQLGFRLDRIQISPVLPPDVGRAIQVALTEAEQRKINEEKQKTAMQELTFQQRAQEFAAWRGRVGELSDRAVRSLGKVLDQIADRVDTAPALRSALSELIAMQRDFAALSSGGTPELVGSEARAVGSGTQLLATAPRTRLASRVERICQAFSTFPDRRDRNRLLSLMLHLLAELALLDEADDQAARECARRLGEEHRRLARSVTEEQRDLLFELQDLDAVLADLAED